MRAIVERAWFASCLALGRLLRGARYTDVRAATHDDRLAVRKRRRWYAPLLIVLGEVLVRILDTGVRVLPRREWHARERLLYRRLGRPPVRVDRDGTLVLPLLPGETLASLLERHDLEAAERTRAIEAAAIALARLHHLGFTHGDAMAENVLVDLPAGVAHWFDFETEHDPGRPIVWRRADDVRALLATCLLRTPAHALATTLDSLLDAYGDDDVAHFLVASFASVRRPLVLHLGQAPMTHARFRRIARLLRARFDR